MCRLEAANYSLALVMVSASNRKQCITGVFELVDEIDINLQTNSLAFSVLQLVKAERTPHLRLIQFTSSEEEDVTLVLRSRVEMFTVSGVINAHKHAQENNMWNSYFSEDMRIRRVLRRRDVGAVITSSPD